LQGPLVLFSHVFFISLGCENKRIVWHRTRFLVMI
jgi:hypothetical protein